MKQWRIWATVLMCCLLVFLIVGTWGMNQRLKLQEAREIYYALKHVSGVVSRMDEAKENEPIAFLSRTLLRGRRSAAATVSGACRGCISTIPLK